MLSVFLVFFQVYLLPVMVNKDVYRPTCKRFTVDGLMGMGMLWSLVLVVDLLAKLYKQVMSHDVILTSIFHCSFDL